MCNLIYFLSCFRRVVRVMSCDKHSLIICPLIDAFLWNSFLSLRHKLFLFSPINLYLLSFKCNLLELPNPTNIMLTFTYAETVGGGLPPHVTTVFTAISGWLVEKGDPLFLVSENGRRSCNYKLSCISFPAFLKTKFFFSPLINRLNFLYDILRRIRIFLYKFY